MDLRYLPRDLLKLMHVVHLMSQKPFDVTGQPFLIGMSEYILYLIILYVKKKNDCIRWCNSCDVFGPFQEVCVKKAEIDINIYL